MTNPTTTPQQGSSTLQQFESWTQAIQQDIAEAQELQVFPELLDPTLSKVNQELETVKKYIYKYKLIQQLFTEIN